MKKNLSTLFQILSFLLIFFLHTSFSYAGCNPPGQTLCRDSSTLSTCNSDGTVSLTDCGSGKACVFDSTTASASCQTSNTPPPPANCTPNSSVCQDVNTLAICSPDGTKLDRTDCSLMGKVCIFDTTFKTAGCQIAPLDPNDPNCFTKCMAQKKGFSVCQGICGGTGGNLGTGGNGNPSQALVNLNQLITGMRGKIGSLTTFGAIISRVLPILYAIAGFGLLIFLIIGGFGYLTSAGDPKKMESAKNTLTMAIVGFVVVIGAFWLTQIVNYIFNLGTGLQ